MKPQQKDGLGAIHFTKLTFLALSEAWTGCVLALLFYMPGPDWGRERFWTLTQYLFQIQYIKKTTNTWPEVFKPRNLMVNVTNAPYHHHHPLLHKNLRGMLGVQLSSGKWYFRLQLSGYVERLCLSVSWRPEPSCVAERVFSPSVTSSRQTDHSHRPLCVCVCVCEDCGKVNSDITLRNLQMLGRRSVNGPG